MLKPMFSIVNKDGKPFGFQIGCGCWQHYFFEKDLEYLHDICGKLNTSPIGGKYKPYSVKQVM